MAYFQVEDVDRKFSRLEELQAAGGKPTIAPGPAPAPAPAERPKIQPAACRPAVKKAGPSTAI